MKLEPGVYEIRDGKPVRVRDLPSNEPNRWAAFTDEELDALSNSNPEFVTEPQVFDAFDRVVAEIDAELKRRRS